MLETKQNYLGVYLCLLHPAALLLLPLKAELRSWKGAEGSEAGSKI